MDANRFDQAVRSLTSIGTRRTLFAFFLALPPLAGLAVLLGEEDSAARRKRRKKRHKRKRKHKKKCKPNSLARTCAGKCGSVKNNCKKTVDCGSCACDPPCPVCQSCDENDGQCIDVANGTSCGDGLHCQAGQCVCDSTSCADGCCQDEQCHVDENDACGTDGEDCVACTSPETCGGGGTPGECGCTPISTCPAPLNCGGIDNECGGTLSCGECTSPDTCGGGDPGEANVCGCTPDNPCTATSCGEVENRCGTPVDCGVCSDDTPICADNVCISCSASDPCTTGCCASDGSCQPGGDTTACGLTGEICIVCETDETCTDGECVLACGAGGTCLAFLTAAGFTGDLGGLNGADAKCQAEAQAAGLSGTYMAWLSTDAESPSTRFTQSTGPYVRVDGATIAVDWSALTDGTLDVALDLTATGEQDVNQPVWTFTHIDGTPAINTDGSDCNGWTTDAQESVGSAGESSGVDSIWTLFEPDDPPACDGTTLGLPRLYCFQQSA